MTSFFWLGWFLLTCDQTDTACKRAVSFRISSSIQLKSRAWVAIRLSVSPPATTSSRPMASICSRSRPAAHSVRSDHSIRTKGMSAKHPGRIEPPTRIKGRRRRSPRHWPEGHRPSRRERRSAKPARSAKHCLRSCPCKGCQRSAEGNRRSPGSIERRYGIRV